jgi:diketogulonate reductase-like aldo/keto reductase
VLPQVLIRWGLQQGVSVIPKSSKFEHILENQDVWKWLISDETIQRLSTLDQARQRVDYYYNETTSPYKTASDFWDGEIE